MAAEAPDMQVTASVAVGLLAQVGTEVREAAAHGVGVLRRCREMDHAVALGQRGDE
jgi:hypothetical protein